MATSLPRGIYPIATQDGEAIPLDIIEPIGLIIGSVSDAEDSVIIPEGFRIAVISVDKETFIRMGTAIGSITEGSYITDMLYIPANSTITVAVPIEETECFIKLANGIEAGKVYIQLVQQWATIGINTQYVRK